MADDGSSRGSQDGGGERRLRSNRRSFRRGRGLGRFGGRFALLRQPAASRAILLVMTALTLAYAAASMWQMRLAATMYGAHFPGMSRADVRYISGPPTAIAGGADRSQVVSSSAEIETASAWLYQQGTTRSRIDFTPAGTIARVTCADATVAPLSCPESAGLGIGTPEDALWSRLGTPTRQSYRGGAKTIYYDDLGLSFTLQRLVVTGISLVRRPGVLSYLPRTFVAMIP